MKFRKEYCFSENFGLAKIANFAKIAKFSLRLRNFRNPSEIFAILAKISGIADFALLCLLSSTASIFLHFAFIFSLILCMIDS